MAARSTDRELDTALICLGILPPLDLAPIRTAVNTVGASLRGSANGDGHRVIDVVVDGNTRASIHHDGRVESRPSPTGVAA